MPTVVIQPSYGNRDARKHWADTLDHEIPFTESPHASCLTEDQKGALLNVHPSGRARFWGATAAQDKNMQRVGFGDIVLFTGLKLVRGIGEVGVIFQNGPFADSMWKPDSLKGSWHNVYSLLSFQAIEIGYEEIWALPGFNHGDNFMGLRVLEGDKAEIVLQGLGIQPSLNAQQSLQQEQEIAAALAQHTQIVPLEENHTSSVSYQPKDEPVLVYRAEALLVQEYVQTLAGLQVQRLRTPAGITDIHVTSPDGTEIIEAKRSGDHRFVRDALGQLLDYAPHSPTPADRLTGLFPVRPSDTDVALLHRYGIDCIFRTAPAAFERLPAPDWCRDAMKKAWSSPWHV